MHGALTSKVGPPEATVSAEGIHELVHQRVRVCVWVALLRGHVAESNLRVDVGEVRQFTLRSPGPAPH